MSDTGPGAHRPDEPQIARPSVSTRSPLAGGIPLAATVTRHGEPNGWDWSAVRAMAGAGRVAHDQVVIFAGRQPAQPLASCSACGRISGPYWWRWRAYRIDDPEFGDVTRVAVYCQSCADHKFGAPRRRPLVERRKVPRPHQPDLEV